MVKSKVYNIVDNFSKNKDTDNLDLEFQV